MIRTFKLQVQDLTYSSDGEFVDMTIEIDDSNRGLEMRVDGKTFYVPNKRVVEMREIFAQVDTEA